MGLHWEAIARETRVGVQRCAVHGVISGTHIFVRALTTWGRHHREGRMRLPLGRGPWGLGNGVEKGDMLFIVYLFVPGTWMLYLKVIADLP